MNNLNTLIYLTILLFAFLSCETDLEKANPFENLSINTGIVTETESFSATVRGVISTNQFTGVDNYGHCWSNLENPTTEDDCTFFGELKSSNYEFTTYLGGLNLGENYFVRGFAVANGVPFYGNQISLQTIWAGDIPLIETGGVNYITSNSAVVSAEIIETGESNIIRYGHCWSESSTPTLADFKSENNENSTGTFTTEFNNLNSSTTYYYRSYAENSQGISFGSILTFATTDGRPSVITTNISEINSNSAVVGGEITGMGDATIIKHGHCWSTSSGPTIDNSSKTEYENGAPGSIFQSDMMNLNTATDYFVRTYATNSFGTSYGDEILFSTTNGLAEVLTISAEVNGTSANLKGEIVSLGDGIIEYGFYVASNSGVNSNNYEQKINLGATNNIGFFESNFNNLFANASYYFRAYAITDLGEQLGDEKVFVTGNQWSNIGVLSGVYDNNNAMHIISENNVWFVGSNIWNWDGSNFNTVSNPSSGNLIAIHGSSSNNMWIASENNEIFRWNGNSWTEINHDMSSIKDILVFQNTIVIGGGSGPNIRISTNSGTNWQIINSSSTYSWHTFRDMDGTSSSNIWVGTGSTTNNGVQGIFKYNGVSWESEQMYNLQCISTVNSNLGFATMHGDIGSWYSGLFQYYNGQLNSMSLPPAASSVWGYTPVDAVNENNVWFGSDKIYKFDGLQWIEETGVIGTAWDGADGIRIIEMLNDNIGYAVTGNGTILKRN